MEEELSALLIEIKNYKEILSSEEKLIDLMVTELNEIKDRFNDSRRTKIDLSGVGRISDEDLIPETDIIITTSVKGYIKRINLEEYNTQKRGGVGSKSMKTYQDDDIAMILQTKTHTDLLLFSNFGKVYKLRGHQIPEGSKQSKGMSIVNILENLDVENNEKIISIISIDDFSDDKYLTTITKYGIIKKSNLSLFKNIRKNGLIAFKLNEKDELVRAFVVSDSDDILVANNYKNIVLFKANEIRSQGRNSLGVKAIKLIDNQRYFSINK
ncbi:hypothetical protein NW731_01085 [Mycoplasmopsis felis]|nr:DNA gyrase C-terminal beta-propeller domain-containing protein [Mycoplasmopsis felis]MCU9937134.1 hypothetical protein [Mycoplasmopsis felis]